MLAPGFWLNLGPFFTGAPCPNNRRCRHSDANFVQKASDVSVTRGSIARNALDSTNWNGTNVWRVTGENAPVLDSTVNKVGYRTGRTRGPVTHTCVRADINDSNISYFCSAVVRAHVDFGDSGSPAFRATNSPQQNDVDLLGVVFGMSEENGERYFWFSRISRIEQDLGALTTCATSFSC